MCMLVVVQCSSVCLSVLARDVYALLPIMDANVRATRLDHRLHFNTMEARYWGTSDDKWSTLQNYGNTILRYLWWLVGFRSMSRGTSLLKRLLCEAFRGDNNPCITTGSYLSWHRYRTNQFKRCSVHTHLITAKRGSQSLPLYISLLFLIKITEWMVKFRLTDCLSSNNLLNSFQSAYIKHHSSETSFLSVHVHIIKAMRHQQVTCLTLLDLAAAFDTIDHTVLLERLSFWFDIISTDLFWVKS